MLLKILQNLQENACARFFFFFFKMRKLNIAGGVFLKLETMFLEKKNPRKTVIANLLNQAFFVNYMLFASYCGI